MGKNMENTNENLLTKQKTKCIFIFNPESGQGKLKRNFNFILDTLTKRYGETQNTHLNF